jgi:beta-N-acetylhexosaminidase
MHNITLKTILLVLLVSVWTTVAGQDSKPPFLKYINHPWVDSVLKSLSPEERVAQLVWIAGFSNRDISYDVGLCNLIEKTGIGGVVFFQDQAVKQSEMINYFRKISKVPPIIATDGEWGIGMRLQDVTKFPYQMTLGAIQNDSLIYQMGKAVARQFRRAGVNINLAPVADVENNPENPVINFRSFGEEPGNVSRKTLMYMNGLQDNGIMAVAKHFPGHGDTETDSHFELPVIRHTRGRLDSVELPPFRSLIRAGISGVMPGHLNVTSLDTTPNIPATLSYNVLTKLLIQELSFSGLVLSDAMNMGGITKFSAPGEAELSSLKAGMDVVEYVTDPERAIKAITEGIKRGYISQDEINDKCRKVLAAKFWAGLNHSRDINTGNILNELSGPHVEALVRDLYANALTVINNKENLIPVRQIDTIKIAALAINCNRITNYQKRISKYVRVDQFFIDTLSKKNSDALLLKLTGYDLVIGGIFNTNQRAASDFGIPEGLNSFLQQLISQNKTIITWFGNPYAIDRLEAIQRSDGLIVAFQENSFTEDLSAQLIFGGIGAKGALPVTINKNYPAGSGIATPGDLRIQFGIPESAGMSSDLLIRKIDSLAGFGISAGAYPGCEVMIARKGIVVFSKTYGYQTYGNRIAVSENDLYDLASVSKISGPVPGLMLLDSEGKFSPDKKLGDYLPDFRKSNKGNIVMRDFLTHQAGLLPWLPFWKETMRNDGRFRKNLLSHEQSKKYPLEVADNLYINKNFRTRMLTEIRKSPLGPGKYLYSDLTFIIAPYIIDRLAGRPWYYFVTTEIYHKIGAFDIGFNPYQRYSMERIVPTEYDSLFRKQLIHGTVHDEAAALQGGISGHAGLFATAGDLMKLMELYRRMGNYGGEQLIRSEVLRDFTRVQFPQNGNPRGLGFDKPSLPDTGLKSEQIYPTKGASADSFGHSGFTGAFVWVDPKAEISYVFLCNRVYPSRNNNLLTGSGIRTKILQAIYDSIETGDR